MFRLDQVVRRPLSAPLAAGWDHRYHQPLPEPVTSSGDGDGLCFLLPVGVHLALTLPCPETLMNRLDPPAVRTWRRQLEILALLWCLDKLYGHPPERLAGMVVSPGTLRRLVFWLAGHPLPPGKTTPVAPDTVRMWRQRIAPWMGPWWAPTGMPGDNPLPPERLQAEEETVAVLETWTGLTHTDRFPPMPVTLSEWASFLEWLLTLDSGERQRLAGWIVDWHPLWRHYPEAWGLLQAETLETLGWFARLALDQRAFWTAAALRLEMLVDLAMFFEMSLLAEVREVWSANAEACADTEMTVFPPLTEADTIGLAWREWLAGHAPDMSPVLIDRLLGVCPTENFQPPTHDIQACRLLSDASLSPGSHVWRTAAARFAEAAPGTGGVFRQRLIERGQWQVTRIHEQKAGASN